jgi:UDP-galactopyranose mutase
VGVSTTIKKIITFFRAKNIYGLGRWGEWEQLNSDAVISRAIKLADTLLKQKRQGAKK